MTCPNDGGQKTSEIFKDLGWMNSWQEDPPEYAECVRLGHARSDVDIGPPHRGLEHVVKCGICKIVARYDSSD